MDILNRKVLNNGDSCYFYVSSVESPYIYIRLKGEIVEKHTINDVQIIYRIKVLEVFETELAQHNYLNNKSYRTYDLSRKVNTTKTFYNFDLENQKDFLKERVDQKYLFECSSATVFEKQEDMHREFKKFNEYIKNMLHDTIQEINIRV